MRISGLQKLSLVDYPGHLAATVFTAGCNLRCPFCHNASLVIRPGEAENISQDDFFGFLEKRHGLLDGICITGGEPLLQPDLEDFIYKVRETGFLVKLDTNGTFPERLKNLLDKKLVDYVAMDVKNSPEKYAETTGYGIPDSAVVEKSAAILMSGDTDYEFRTTVIKELHTVDDIEKIGVWLKGAKRYFLQCFKDSGDLIADSMSECDADTMHRMLNTARPYFGEAALRGLD